MALPAHATPHAVVIVTNDSDSGAGSLRDAIGTASPDSTIVFSLTLPATITLSSRLDVTTSLTISGPGASLLAISGNNVTRVISVTSGVALNLSDITIANGSGGNGGGIYNNFGTISITSTVFYNNFALFGGGGIINFGMMNFSDSTLTSNNAIAGGGGGIANGGTLNITNTTFSNNSNGNQGGAIFNFGVLTMSNSTVSYNHAIGGGGIVTSVGSTTNIINSTFYSNTATVVSYEGGAISNAGILTITNSTFADNSAAGNGGGISNSPTYSGVVSLRNTIIANSPSGGNCFGITTNGGNNIDDDSTCGWGTANGSMSNTDPRLGSLSNNGGSTQTIRVLPGSPAIDGVTFNAPNGCPSTDQRGALRPIGARCDIGAYEAGYLFLPLILR